jgi:hypothetical protein
MSDTEVTGNGSKAFQTTIDGRWGINERTELFHGPSGPHGFRADPMPSFGLVRVSEKSFETIDYRIHLLELLSLWWVNGD